MNATEIWYLGVKTLLGVDPKDLVKAEAVTLEELTLENGTTLTAEKFEAGEEVFSQTEDEKVPMPIASTNLKIIEY